MYLFYCSIVHVNKLPYTYFFKKQVLLLLSLRSNIPMNVYLWAQKRLHDVRKAKEVAKRCRSHFHGNANPRNEHTRALLCHVAREHRGRNEQAQTVKRIKQMKENK